MGRKVWARMFGVWGSIYMGRKRSTRGRHENAPHKALTNAGGRRRPNCLMNALPGGTLDTKNPCRVDGNVDISREKQLRFYHGGDI